ncbi:ATP-dependent DNA helicase RecQ [Staphylococcus sp. 17KM0847]|uniref:RecQ family ATP-dependent DNA helicase n=1 Tax=Staphylococcus sp. 17KM0847 TaxID=2583989 RepID=UPI0015DCBD47|nr:ATP-dependent DNA helicase RecQ [Staphylococcus sp. 17KM0847]QLK86126.1 ATP-dependent DNA helicase RecQ [Staphylococcus sp. 17KM0847]
MLKQALQQYFGFDDFRPGQESIIQHVLDEHNVLGILPTGSGKSLCYQLPTYIKRKPTLIISPLISLMDDQVMQMKMKGEHRVVSIHSGMETYERQLAFQRIHTSRFIFVSPEFILQSHHFEQFQTIDFGLIVLDEVHCLSEWGFDFRPHYALIGDIIQHYQQATVLALTATATPHLQRDVEFITGRLFHTLQSSMDRSNIMLSVKHMNSYDEKITWILEHISTSGPTIIYVSSKKICLELAEEIYKEGYLTGIYHSDLSYQERHTVQQQFLNNDIRIIVATSAFGMGVNKSDIRTVIHFHIPPSPSNYLQEIGRAGRDGQQSQAIALYQYDDQFLMEMLGVGNIIHDEDISLYEQGELIDFEKKHILDLLNVRYSTQQLKQIFQHNFQQKQRAYQYMLNYATTTICRRSYLLQFFDMSKETHTLCCDLCDNLTMIDIPNKKKVKRALTFEEKLKSLFN